MSMDTLRFFLGIGLAVVLVFSAASVYMRFSGNPPPAADPDTLYQVSTIDALVQGVYDGVQTVGEVRRHGDFGIGTFDALDGEMIVLDGVVYQAKADGHVFRAADAQTTPFATVTFFGQDRTLTTDKPMNQTLFAAALTEALPSQNMIYAVRMHALFPAVKVRAIPPQARPYPPLARAAEGQSVYSYTNVSGTMAGFYSPAFLSGLNAPGLHLHFISDDRSTGGHLLDCMVPGNSPIAIDITQRFEMVLPDTGGFSSADLSKNLTAELIKAEG